MKENQENMKDYLDKIICNKCGRELTVENQIPREDYIMVRKQWGYFSEKDGKTYSFVLCEECSDRLVQSFIIPVDVQDTTELL